METAASIIAVMQLSEKVIKYIRDVSGATEDRKRLREQVRACSNILLTLRDGVEDSEEGQTWADTIEVLAPPLLRLQTALELAALKLQARDCVKEKLRWPFKEKEVQKLIEAIESEKGLLALALDNNSARLLHEINARSRRSNTDLSELTTLFEAHVTDSRTDASDLKTAVATVQDFQIGLQENLGRMRAAEAGRDMKKDRLDIIRWLSPIDHALQQHDKISRRQIGTCEWFLRSQVYKNWLYLKGEVLFCPGIPGAGKTILSSVVVADLWQICGEDSSIVAVYFFCEFGQQREQTVDAIMLSLLKQLVESRPEPSSYILALYDRFGEGRKRPLHADIMAALLCEIDLYAKVFILVDALDECRVSTELLSELFKLQEQSKFNLIATSRPIPEIKALFEGKSWIAIHASNEDVQTYLDAQMRKSPKFTKFDLSLQNEVKMKITESVQGMFLLAKLHLDSLTGKRSVKALRETLKKLATGLGAYDSAYASAMERIESQVPDQVELAKQVIAWIVHAKRRITATELQEALGVELGERDIDRDNCPDVDDMVSACAGLVTIDEGSNVIRLVHYTTQEYFVRTKEALFPTAEAMIALLCMTYLSFDCWGKKNTKIARLGYVKYVLCPYAAQYWGIHAKLAPAALPQVMDFLRRPRHVAETNLLGRHESGIHASALFGLNEAARSLLEESVDKNPNLENLKGSTPLMFAAFGGHESVVKLFLEYRAGVNWTNKDGFTPLYIAIISGHTAVVRLLLNWHADVHGGPRSQSLLDLAMKRGDEDVVRLLLEAGASLQFENDNSETLLQLACRQNKAAIFKLLLDAGAAVNHQGRYGASALHIVSFLQRTEIVELLLKAGADVNVLNNVGESPLSIACAQGNEAIVKLLLNAGAAVNTPSTSPSPLDRACSIGKKCIIALLLSAGAETNHEDMLGYSPLHYASRTGQQTAVKMLLDAGADIEGQNNEGSSSLHVACHHGHRSTVQMLLDNGAELERQASKGRTPLFFAGYSNYFGVAIVKSLLSRGANVHHKDHNGQTPLHFASQFNRVDVITELLKAGLDIDCQDKEGRSPLFYACKYSSGGAVKKLIQAGANIHLKDVMGRTAFEVIHGGEHSTITKSVWPHDGRVAVEITPPSPVVEHIAEHKEALVY